MDTAIIRTMFSRSAAMRTAVRRAHVIRHSSSSARPKKPALRGVPVGGSGTASGGRGPISWLSFALFTGAGTGLLYYYASEKERQMRGKKSYIRLT